MTKDFEIRSIECKSPFKKIRVGLDVRGMKGKFTKVTGIFNEVMYNGDKPVITKNTMSPVWCKLEDGMIILLGYKKGINGEFEPRDYYTSHLIKKQKK